jgi:hypothetical protein
VAGDLVGVNDSKIVGINCLPKDEKASNQVKTPENF